MGESVFVVSFYTKLLHLALGSKCQQAGAVGGGTEGCGVGWIYLEDQMGAFGCVSAGGGSRRSGSGGRELRVKHNLDGWEWSLLFKALERAGLAEVASGMSEGTTGHLRGY